MKALPVILLLCIPGFLFADEKTNLQKLVDNEVRRQKEAREADAIVIYFVSKGLMPLIPISPTDLRANATFRVNLLDGKNAALAIDWFNIAKSSSFPIINTTKPDIRVLIDFGKESVSFTADGAKGYINDSPVHFTKQAKLWFDDRINPMLTCLSKPPSQK
jgi:hypothetical protein